MAKLHNPSAEVRKRLWILGSNRSLTAQIVTKKEYDAHESEHGTGMFQAARALNEERKQEQQKRVPWKNV